LHKDRIRGIAEFLVEEMLIALSNSPFSLSSTKDKPIARFGHQDLAEFEANFPDVKGKYKRIIFLVRAELTSISGIPYKKKSGFFQSAGWGYIKKGSTKIPVIVLIFNGVHSPQDVLNFASTRGGKDILLQEAYSDLIHELTHAKEIEGKKRKTSAERLKEGGTKAYYADAWEVRAYMQQIVDEALKNFPKRGMLYKKMTFDKALAINSPTWRRVKKEFSEENQYKIMSSVYQMLSEAGFRIERKGKLRNPKGEVSFPVDPFRPKNKGQKSRWENHYYPFTKISVDVEGKDVWTGTISRRDFDDGDLQQYVVLIFGQGYKSFKPDYTSHYSIPFGKLNAQALKQAKKFVKDFYADKIDKKEFIPLWQHEAEYHYGTPKRKESRRYNPNDRHEPINPWIKKGREGSELQTIMFDRDYFNGHAARSWLKDHEFAAPKTDKTEKFLRYRQGEPQDFQKGSFRTITLTKGIKAVVGIPKLRRNPKYPIQLVPKEKVKLVGFAPAKIRQIKHLIRPAYALIEEVAGKKLKFPSPIYAMNRIEINEGKQIVDKGHPNGAGHGLFYPAFRLIKINPNMVPDEILANVIHENLHYTFPTATEIDVDKLVGLITLQILGYENLGDTPI